MIQEYQAKNGRAQLIDAQRESEIPAEMCSLCAALDCLEKAISEHHQRMSPILRQEPPTQVGAQTKEETSRFSSLGGEIQHARQRLELLTAELQQITRLAEI